MCTSYLTYQRNCINPNSLSRLSSNLPFDDRTDSRIPLIALVAVREHLPVTAPHSSATLVALPSTCPVELNCQNDSYRCPSLLPCYFRNQLLCNALDTLAACPYTSQNLTHSPNRLLTAYQPLSHNFQYRTSPNQITQLRN